MSRGMRIPDPSEQGMALIVALVFLLLLTLIGLNSMQNATLQEKMSSSVQFRNQSFQQAEAALRMGETAVSKTSYTLAVCSGTTACAPPPDSGSVTAAGNGKNVTWIAAGTNAVYGVQNLGTSSGAVGCTTQSQTLYRITGVGFIGTAQTVLESIYAKNC